MKQRFVWEEKNYYIKECEKQKRILAVAESCTGGMLSSHITSISGSSKIFDRGFITYSNDAKIELINSKKIVSSSLIRKLLENISEAKPTIMTAVPRFYQNLYNKINMNLKKQTGFKDRKSVV